MVDTTFTQVISASASPDLNDGTDTFITHKRIILNNNLVSRKKFGVDNSSVDYDFVTISDSSALIPDYVFDDLDAYVTSDDYGDEAETEVFVTTPPSSTHNGYIRVYDAPMTLKTRYGLQVFPGEIYEVRARYQPSTANIGGEMYVTLGVEAFNSSGVFLGTHGIETVYEYETASSVWQDLVLEVTSAAILAAYPSTAYVRAYGDFNQNDDEDYGRGRVEAFKIVKTTSARGSLPSIVKRDMDVVYRNAIRQDVIDVWARTIRPLSKKFTITSNHNGNYYIDNGYIIFEEPEYNDVTIEYTQDVIDRAQEARFELDGIDIVSYRVDDLADIIGFKRVGLKVIVNEDDAIYTWDGEEWVVQSVECPLVVMQV